MGNKACRVALRLDEPQGAHQAGNLVNGRKFFERRSYNLILFGELDALLFKG
jgi:hypothetical protein